MSRIALRVGPDQPEAVAALVSRRAARVGLAGPLADLDRAAERCRFPHLRLGRRARLLLRWDAEDFRTQAWWPQGISTSADTGRVPGGRDVVLVSWYAAPRRGAPHAGSRISVLDVSDLDRVRYRHVLLVRAVVDGATGEVSVEPVSVHAGGLAWFGDLLYVASTYEGLRVFDLRDLLKVPPEQTAATLGNRYVLPECFSYLADPPHGMRYSFVSVDRTSAQPALVAGEYTRGPLPARLVRFDVDPVSCRLVTAESGTAIPSYVAQVSIRSMQGALALDGTYVVSASHGRHRRGDLWVGVPEPGGAGLTRKRRVLPVGPEDLACWNERDELWGLSEYPGRRHIFALGRSAVRPAPIPVNSSC